MNVKNDREHRIVIPNCEEPITPVTEEEVRETQKKMKKGNSTGPNEIPAEVWTCGNTVSITKMFNELIKTKEMPSEWRRS